jgi:hypothetical protein
MSNFNRFIALVFLIGLAACSGGGDSAAPTPTPPTPPTPTVNPPTAATLSLPEKNKTCESGVSISTNQSDITFTWAAGTNTESYDLLVTNLNTNVVQTFSNIVASSQKVTLNKATPYSWKVISKSSKTTTTATSDSWNFYLAGSSIVNYAPFPAEITAPIASIFPTITNGKVTISWKGSDPESDPLTYTLFVDLVDGKQTPAASFTNITASRVDVPVETGKVYFFRVKSSDGKNSSYSVIYQFRT